jgi:hypothetical protein
MAEIKGDISAVHARNINEISVRNSRTGEIHTSILTKDTQVGVSNIKCSSNPKLKTYGEFKAYCGISGSLTRLTSGESYLVAGSGITILTSSIGQVTITAGSISPAATLTMGSGFSPYNAVYNGTATTAVGILAEPNKGLSVSSAGIGISQASLTSLAAPSLSDEMIVFNASSPFRSTINSILNLGVSSNITLSNPITIGLGLQDSATPANTTYNNVSAVTLAAKLESSKGLGVTASGVKIDPSTISSATVATGDKVLIGDVNDSDNIKYVTAQSIANLASVGTLTNPITVGNGLSPNGDTFDGSVAKTFAVAAADSTVAVNSSGVAVAKVPNSLTHGNGLSSFTFDGSAAASMTVQAASQEGLKVSAAGVGLDITNIPDSNPETGDYFIFYDYNQSITTKATIAQFNANFIPTELKSPYALSQGAGINPFGYDGSSAGQVVAVNYSQVAGIAEDNTFTGDNTFANSIFGSIQEVSPGTDYLVAGSNVTIAKDTPGAGQITISSTGGGGSIPTTAPVVTWAADATLSDERILTASSGFSIVNNGVDKLTLTTNPQKVPYQLTGSLPGSHILTVPGIEFQDNAYSYNKTDIFLNGALLLSGSVNDYYLEGSPAGVIFTFDLFQEDSLLFKLV